MDDSLTDLTREVAVAQAHSARANDDADLQARSHEQIIQKLRDEMLHLVDQLQQRDAEIATLHEDQKTYVCFLNISLFFWEFLDFSQHNCMEC